MIKVLNKDGSIFDTFQEYQYSELTYNDTNQINNIKGNPKKYLGKIFYIYDEGNLVGSGIVNKYSFDKNNNKGSVTIYPLLYDLRNEFLTDETGNEVYFNDTFENVLTYIIEQYISLSDNPLLYLKDPLVNSGSTGITVKFTFSYKNLLEAFNLLLKKFLPIEKNIFIHPDGGIEIINVSTKRIANYGNDVKIINYTESIDTIYNYIIFDNQLAGDDHILKTYQDAQSIADNEKRVYYYTDQRVTDETTADQMVASYLSKYKDPIIEINDITVDNLDIGIYDQITINNWDKTFEDDIYVVGISYVKGGFKKLKVGTKFTREILSEDDVTDSISAGVSYSINYSDLPDYITETYIDSVEIKSPSISGNFGYFTGLFKVGSDGIEISGTDKTIYSSNYSAGSTGWIINNDGSAEFLDVSLRGDLYGGKTSYSDTAAGFWIGEDLSEYKFNIGDSSKYIQWDGSTLDIKGDIEATSGYFSGGVSVGSGGSIYGGKPTYGSTAAGFWLGYDSGDYKFNIGDDSSFIKWDGSDVLLSGTVASGGSIISGTSTQYVKISDYSVYFKYPGYELTMTLLGEYLNIEGGGLYLNGFYGIRMYEPVSYNEGELIFASGGFTFQTADVVIEEQLSVEGKMKLPVGTSLY